jgi:hypothetical protein
MSKEIIPIERIAQSIHWIRGQKVQLDSNLSRALWRADGKSEQSSETERAAFSD